MSSTQTTIQLPGQTIVYIGDAAITLAGYPQVTPGIARNMQTEVAEPSDVPVPQGGGDLNGSANTANLLGQAGTPGTQIGLARTLGSTTIMGVTN